MRSKMTSNRYGETISRHGLRFTEQRRHVYEALLGKRDHPTAVEVFMRVKTRMPSISLATVYNCLETLTGCGLVKHVNIDRGPSRYCPNLEDHGHFFCDVCNTVIDIPLRKQRSSAWQLPPDAVLSQRDVSLRGLCPDCAKSRESKGSKSKTKS
jgi:Fe2+ or Zn2+ uptake regulation protein